MSSPPSDEHRSRAHSAGLTAAWLIVDGTPLYHRECRTAGDDATAIVHVSGFGISGDSLVPTADRLSLRFRNFVPDLPGMGRSMRRDQPLDVPGYARALVSYCDEIGVQRAVFVGNSSGCPIICELAASYPDRVQAAVLVSAAGGPRNRPLVRALAQLAVDGLREPPGLLAIAFRDYLRFGPLRAWRLFRSLDDFPTLERLHELTMPVLLVAGARDPLVNAERFGSVTSLPHVAAVEVPGAHALNFSSPVSIAALVEAHLNGTALCSDVGPLATVRRFR